MKIARFEDYWRHVAYDNIMGSRKTRNLFIELIKTKNLDGLLCEIGCFKGRTSKFMNLVFPGKKLEIYDTFAGISGANPEVDWVKNGEFCHPLDAVKKFVGEKNVSYFVGFFPDSYDLTREAKYSFVHSDTDTYIGTKSTLDVLWPRMVVGGILMFDDYNFGDCPGVTKAIHEWLIHAKDVKINGKYPMQIAFEKCG